LKQEDRPTGPKKGGERHDEVHFDPSAAQPDRDRGVPRRGWRRMISGRGFWLLGEVKDEDHFNSAALVPVVHRRMLLLGGNPLIP
jgi:hypothetical protein